MADKDKFVNIAYMKAKLRYWCKSRGASKTVQESLMETIKRIPYTVKSDIESTLVCGMTGSPIDKEVDLIEWLQEEEQEGGADNEKT